MCVWEELEEEMNIIKTHSMQFSKTYCSFYCYCYYFKDALSALLQMDCVPNPHHLKAQQALPRGGGGGGRELQMSEEECYES